MDDGLSDRTSYVPSPNQLGRLRGPVEMLLLAMSYESPGDISILTCTTQTPTGSSESSSA